MIKILIIGCGYIGLALAHELSLIGYQVTGTTTREERIHEIEDSGAAAVVWNGDVEPLKALLNDHEIIIVTVAPGKNSDYRQTYLATAEKIQLALLAQNFALRKSKKIIYTSSTSVYAENSGGWVTEDQETNPTTPQGKILRETEQVYEGFSEISNSVNSLIYRLAGIYGPGRELEARLDHTATFPGDGSTPMNLIHRDRIVGAIVYGIEHNLKGIYNLCEDRHPTRKEFYTELAKRLGKPEPRWDPSLPAMHASNKYVSNQKIKQAGFDPNTDS
jgi:nucleoside-diphosphate-sugar epimerase